MGNFALTPYAMATWRHYNLLAPISPYLVSSFCTLCPVHEVNSSVCYLETPFWLCDFNEKDCIIVGVDHGRTSWTEITDIWSSATLQLQEWHFLHSVNSSWIMGGKRCLPSSSNRYLCSKCFEEWYFGLLFSIRMSNFQAFVTMSCTFTYRS